MRIYLACTVRGDRSQLQAARAVAERLEALGHEVLTLHLLDEGVDRKEAALSDREVFERDVRWLEECDVLVAEASGSSYGVGFEVGYVAGRAAQSGQRVIVFYEAARRGTVSRLVSGNTNGVCRTVPYRSLDEITAFLDREFATPKASRRAEGVSAASR